MNCRTCTANLSAYHDRRLEGSRTEAVKTHLQDCEACAGKLREMERLSALMATARTDPPEGLSARITARAMAAGQRRSSAAFLDRWIPVAWPTAAIGAAAAAVLFAVLVRGGGAGGEATAQVSDPVEWITAGAETGDDVLEILAMEEE